MTRDMGRGRAQAMHWDDSHVLAGERRPLGQIVGLCILGSAIVIIVLSWLVTAWRQDRDTDAFPASGSVTVSYALKPKIATSGLAITAGDDPAIVQLLTPETGNHVMSIYMQPHERRIVPAPPGQWRLRTIIGRDWKGPRKLFGAETHVKLWRGPFQLNAGIARPLDLAIPFVGFHAPPHGLRGDRQPSVAGAAPSLPRQGSHR